MCGTDQSDLARQVVNLVSNRVARILGKVENSERFLRLALYQGVPSSGTTKSKRLGAGVKVHETDPTLVACAHNRPRLFLFTRREPADTDEAAAGRCDRALRRAGCSDSLINSKLVILLCMQRWCLACCTSACWQLAAAPCMFGGRLDKSFVAQKKGKRASQGVKCVPWVERRIIVTVSCQLLSIC